MKAVKLTLIAVAVLAVVAPAGAADSHKVLEQNQPPVRAAGRCSRTWLTQPPNRSNALFSDASCDLCGQPQVLAGQRRRSALAASAST